MSDKRCHVPLVVKVGLFLAALTFGCSGSGSGGTDGTADTLSQRQKDSIVSTLPVPGAGAVGRALDAADAARARAETHDTIH